jgi:hypothetical protein
MRLRTGLAIAVLLLAGACGGSETPKDEPTTEASPSASEPTKAANDLESQVIEPGKVGPFVVGLSASEALDQGLIREAKTAPCPGFEATEPLQDVYVLFSGASEPKPKLLGVLVKVEGPKTRDGIGVGSSIADLKSAYGDELSLEEGDYGEKVFRLYEGDRAMGFSSAEGTKPSMKIDAIEVFAKSDPVIWDGC